MAAQMAIYASAFAEHSDDAKGRTMTEFSSCIAASITYWGTILWKMHELYKSHPTTTLAK